MREVRLAALRDAPQAFGSTYERELAFTEEEWRRRVATGLKLLAMLDGQPVGHAGGLPSAEEPGAVDLVGMWVDPAARGRGVGEALVESVTRWAATQGAQRVCLWVTETNVPAQRLYERCGFMPTGDRMPMPRDHSITEIKMARELGSDTA